MKFEKVSDDILAKGKIPSPSFLYLNENMFTVLMDHERTGTYETDPRINFPFC